MRLYLVQHGAAKTEAEDPQRGITEEGRRAVERTADFLAALRLPLDRIEHSEKLRARQTAEILAARLRPAEGTRQIAGIAPNDDVEPMRARLAKESKNLMLVGHLPYLSRLLARLLGQPADTHQLLLVDGPDAAERVGFHALVHLFIGIQFRAAGRKPEELDARRATTPRRWSPGESPTLAHRHNFKACFFRSNKLLRQRVEKPQQPCGPGVTGGEARAVSC